MVMLPMNLLSRHSEGHKASFAGANSISLKKILDMFYDKVVAHEQIGHYFVGIDMGKLKRHQVRHVLRYTVISPCNGHRSSHLGH
jgi:truncated hemoglobin YjbI